MQKAVIIKYEHKKQNLRKENSGAETKQKPIQRSIDSRSKPTFQVTH